MRKALTWSVVLLAAGVALGGAGYAARLSGSSGRRLTATGVVVGTPDAGRVQVAHDEISGYMPPMTMTFALGPAERAVLAPGDRIRFTLRTGPDETWMEGVRVTSRGSLPAPARPLAPVDRLRRGDVLPEVTLVDQDGRPVRTADLRGRPTVLTFIYTRCPVPEFCPLVSRRFGQLQAALAADHSPAHDARLLSVTLEPEFDTAPILTAYARSLNANPARWVFAGGDPAQVTRLARAFSVFVERQGALLDHTLATALVDADGRVTEIWRGSGWTVSEVVEALRAVPRSRP